MIPASQEVKHLQSVLLRKLCKSITSATSIIHNAYACTKTTHMSLGTAQAMRLNLQIDVIDVHQQILLLE